MKISFLFDIEKLTQGSTEDRYMHLYTVLEELCCDEYYIYFDEISNEFVKFFTKKCYKDNLELVVQLLTMCFSNNSILAFEHLLDKFKSIITFDIFLECIQGMNPKIKSGSRYMQKLEINHKFIKYMLDTNPKFLSSNLLVKNLMYKCYFNKHVETLKLLHENCTFFTDHLKNDNAISSAGEHITSLFTLLRIACSFTQFQVVKFILEKNKNIIDYVLQNKIANDENIKEFVRELRYCIQQLCYSVEKPVYNVDMICKILDLLFETFGYNVFASLMKDIQFVCYDWNVLKWFKDKNLQFSDSFYRSNLNQTSYLICPENNIQLFHKMAIRKAHHTVKKIYVNGKVQYMNKQMVFQWASYYFTQYNVDDKWDVASSLMMGQNKHMTDYIFVSGLYKKIPNIEQQLVGHKAWYCLEQYLYLEMIRTRGKFIEYYGEKHSRGKLNFL